ncbi:RICIN domain-containing protein [Streptomyces lichenis]|uniref:RICIN domain-containing protein n=1 Tax=Streptomyces lichenis TaxID=2306967 RepID=A0ABT0IB28_9ACTN|nr:RICIN domain-containing protein [Streptomyces lichenis]MCK8678529.1 RICIN domain-containing protein [Streptomyces lichenis]
MAGNTTTKARDRVLGRLVVASSTVAALLLGAPGTGATAEAGALALSGPANVANAGQCWDLASNALGTEVGVFTCHNESTYLSQKWYRSIDAPSVHNIQNVNGLCMDLRTNDVGARVIMASCHFEESYRSQKWYPVGEELRNFRNSNGLCIERPPTAGGPVVMAPCRYEDSYASQKWTTTGAW